MPEICVRVRGEGRTLRAEMVRFPDEHNLSSAFDLLNLILTSAADPQFRGNRRKYRIRVLQRRTSQEGLLAVSWHIVGTFDRTKDPELIEERCVKVWERMVAKQTY